MRLNKMQRFIAWLAFYTVFLTLGFFAAGLTWGTEDAGALVLAGGGVAIFLSSFTFLSSSEN